MPLISNIRDIIEIKDNKVILKKTIKPKKITGTRLSSIIEKNNAFSSEFKTWLDIFGLYKSEPEPLITEAGKVIEEKIIDFASIKTNHKYKQTDPKLVHFDCFSKNEIFGGMYDGMTNDEYEYKIVEIKTVSYDKFAWQKKQNEEWGIKYENNLPIIKEKNGNLSKWFDNNKNIIIPTNYKLQLSLYLYLLGISKGMFVVSFLNLEDYLNPTKFLCTDNNTYFVSCSINEQFKKYIDYATEWYKKYVLTMTSPEMSEDDKIWFNKLLIYNI